MKPYAPRTSLALLLVSSCVATGDGDVCRDDEDCPSTQRCVDGDCLVASLSASSSGVSVASSASTAGPGPSSQESGPTCSTAASTPNPSSASPGTSNPSSASPGTSDPSSSAVSRPASTSLGCAENQTRPCGSAEGACRQGTQTCTGGQWGECQGGVPSVPEVCHDGVDNNCDGSTDEGCTCPVGQEVRVDNDTAGSGYSEERPENWVSNSVNACAGSYRYLSHTVGDGSRRGKAIWRPAVRTAGMYRVTTGFRATENRTGDADYYIYDDRGGTTHKTVNQRNGSGCTRADLGLAYCLPGGNCRLVLDGDDGASDAADITTFRLESCGNQPAPDAGVPTGPCGGIRANSNYEVCVEQPGVCHGVFTNGAGCVAFCAAAGMVCTARFGGEPGCQKEPQNVLGCSDNNGHQSDWCECASP